MIRRHQRTDAGRHEGPLAMPDTVSAATDCSPRLVRWQISQMANRSAYRSGTSRIIPINMRRSQAGQPDSHYVIYIAQHLRRPLLEVLVSHGGAFQPPPSDVEMHNGCQPRCTMLQPFAAQDTAFSTASVTAGQLMRASYEATAIEP